jgi:4-amino-4-deoxy-L-arabinose transferase-like glycosyltransferase
LPTINLLEIGLLLLLGYALVQSTRFGIRILAYPYPVDYGEGPLLSQVGRLANFENIYTANLTQPPYTITNYPPLYMLLQVPLNWVFGPAFWYGRLLSLLSMAAAAVFLGLTVQALTRDWLAGLVAGSLMLTIPYVKAWAPLFRIDPLALGLSWSALFVLVRGRLTNRKLWLVASLLTEAIYTRQSYGLAAPLAAFTWLLAQKPRRQAFTLAAYVAGLGLALFTLLNLATCGGFFFNIITANLNIFKPAILLYYVGRILGDVPGLIGLSMLYLLFGRKQEKAWWLAGLYLFGGLVSAATIGKIGSNVNYLLELSAGLCLIAGLVMAWLRRQRRSATLPASPWSRAKIGWQVASLGLTTLLVAQVVWASQIDNGYDQYLLQKTGLSIQNEVLLRLIKQTDGPVLTGEHMGLLALTDRPIYYQPFEMKQLSDTGVWDQTPFLVELENGQYPLILMYHPQGSDVHERRWTPEMLEVISEHYRYVNNFDQTIVYEWKK